MESFTHALLPFQDIFTECCMWFRTHVAFLGNPARDIIRGRVFRHSARWISLTWKRTFFGARFSTPNRTPKRAHGKQALWSNKQAVLSAFVQSNLEPDPFIIGEVQPINITLWCPWLTTWSKFLDFQSQLWTGKHPWAQRCWENWHHRSIFSHRTTNTVFVVLCFSLLLLGSDELKKKKTNPSFLCFISCWAQNKAA